MINESNENKSIEYSIKTNMETCLSIIHMINLVSSAEIIKLMSIIFLETGSTEFLSKEYYKIAGEYLKSKYPELGNLFLSFDDKEKLKEEIEYFSDFFGNEYIIEPMPIETYYRIKSSVEKIKRR